MIIDVHAHWGPWFFAMDVADVSDNVHVMDRYGIDLQIVSATEAVVYDPRTGNRRLADVLTRTDRLLGYLAINPRDLAAAEDDIAELLPTGRFVGAKIHTDYTDSPVGSPQMRDALTLLDELDLPVLVHTWDRAVLELAQLCAELPRLRAIAGHMGGTDSHWAVEATRVCPRLYLEPSCSHAPAGRFRQVAEHVDPHRLLFGTDSTLIDPAVALGAVAAARLPTDVVEHVMWRNAAELFALPTP
ncbi:amidohydrolase family protein [Streptomyces spiralis]|uniref:amidohydrolase family protein n=1 Tax=Streptomyces spiralis TaxID=66376 RepID=UPI003696ED8C